VRRARERTFGDTPAARSGEAPRRCVILRRGGGPGAREVAPAARRPWPDRPR